MAMAVALVVIVAASLLFHFVSPWGATPLASNWREMDDTLAITLAITTVFFVVINLFIGYMLLRFRHRAGHRAAWQPDNRKLEYWLTGVTALAIMALLAPGLFVYAEYIRPPRDAIELEVFAKQWQWGFRFPGADGRFGRSDARFISAGNPFGLDPGDPAGQQNVMVLGSEVHLPLNKPVKVLLRSQDVLHDFYVPPFRARMNMVPGMVTSFWFTPSKAGRYEVLCAQLCGIGHYNMRGFVVVEDETAFRRWLKGQPTFAASLKAPPGGAHPLDPLAERGRALAQAKGCVACHTVDGSPGVGPTWKGLFGKIETMADGSTALVDEAYLKDFILHPQARLVKGFSPIMPKIELTDAELAAVVAYIKSWGRAGQSPLAEQARQ